MEENNPHVLGNAPIGKLLLPLIPQHYYKIFFLST